MFFFFILSTIFSSLRKNKVFFSRSQTIPTSRMKSYRKFENFRCSLYDLKKRVLTKICYFHPHRMTFIKIKISCIKFTGSVDLIIRLLKKNRLVIHFQSMFSLNGCRTHKENSRTRASSSIQEPVLCRLFYFLFHLLSSLWNAAASNGLRHHTGFEK